MQVQPFALPRFPLLALQAGSGYLLFSDVPNNKLWKWKVSNLRRSQKMATRVCFRLWWWTKMVWIRLCTPRDIYRLCRVISFQQRYLYDCRASRLRQRTPRPSVKGDSDSGNERSYTSCQSDNILVLTVCPARLSGGRMLLSKRVWPTPMFAIDLLG